MNTKRRNSRIPKFKSYEEEANWWDTHDTTEFEDEFKPVELEVVKPLIHILGVRLNAKTIDKLSKLGSEMGVGASTLARMWIMEKLNKTSKKNQSPQQLSSNVVLHKVRSPR